MKYLLLILVCNIFHVQSCRSQGLHGLHDEEASDQPSEHAIRVQRVSLELPESATGNSMKRAELDQVEQASTGTRKSDYKVDQETNDLQRPFDDLGVYKNRLNVEKLLRPNEDELKSLSDLSKLLKNGILMDAATRMDFVQNYFEKFCRRHRSIPAANSKRTKEEEVSDQPKKTSMF